jgi:hypothetical protein
MPGIRACFKTSVEVVPTDKGVGKPEDYTYQQP